MIIRYNYHGISLIQTSTRFPNEILSGRREARALKRSYALSCSAVMRSRTGTSSLFALDPQSGQEIWRRLAEGRFGFIALHF